MVDRVDINNVLMQMRQLKMQAQSNPSSAFQVRPTSDVVAPQTKNLTVGAKPVPDFGDMFSKAINNVNAVQKESGALSRAYELGDPKVDITRVMIASQKSSVSFQALLQVRNKVISAYEEVMNMPI